MLPNCPKLAKTPLIACNERYPNPRGHFCARKLTPPKKRVHFCARKRAPLNPPKNKKIDNFGKNTENYPNIHLTKPMRSQSYHKPNKL